MTKEVLLSLQGLQFDTSAEDGDKIETITPAEYYKRNDSHYVIFEELMEGFTDTTKNVIKFRDSQLEVTKKGLVNVHMVFEENRKNMTSYATPFGNILIGIDTDEVEIREEEDRIQVNVAYTLEANYEHMADCKIEMSIRPREEGLEL